MLPSSNSIEYLLLKKSLLHLFPLCLQGSQNTNEFWKTEVIKSILFKFHIIQTWFLVAKTYNTNTAFLCKFKVVFLYLKAATKTKSNLMYDWLLRNSIFITYQSSCSILLFTALYCNKSFLMKTLFHFIRLDINNRHMQKPFIWRFISAFLAYCFVSHVSIMLSEDSCWEAVFITVQIPAVLPHFDIIFLRDFSQDNWTRPD